MAAFLFDQAKRGIATITLNKPESFNTFDPQSISEFVGILDMCARNAGVRLLCIRAAGKHFCAGADVRALPGQVGPIDAGDRGPTLSTMLRRLNAMPLPTIALVQGACIGGGAGLVSCCDVVIAETTAFLSISEVRLGIPPVALIPYFAAVIGQRQLRRYALSGERINATQARDIGFVHEICPPGQLASAAEPIIDALLRGGPLALAQTKRMIEEAAPMALSEEREAALAADFDEIIASPEAKEGVSAFREKRTPRWYHSS